MNVEARVGAGIQPAGDGLQDSTGQTLQLANVLRLLQLRWRLIFGVALVPFLIATAVIFSLTPQYRAEALVSLDQRTNSVIDADAVLSKLSGDTSTVQAQLQILSSRSFLSRIVDEAGLESDASLNRPVDSLPDLPGGDVITNWLTDLRSTSWFKDVSEDTTQAGQAQDVRDALATELLTKDVELVSAPPGGAQNRKDAIIDRLLRALTVSQVGLSPAIRIQFASENPQQAARIANAIADAYISDQLNTRVEATETASNFLADRTNELRAEAQAAQAAVTQFRSSKGVVEDGGGRSAVDQQLVSLSTELVAARLNLTDQQSKANRVRQLQQAGRSFDVTQVVDSAVIAQLRTEENELLRQEAELSTRYGPRHPRMIDLESQKADLQRKIAQEVGRITQATSNNVETAQVKVASLEQSIRALESTVGQRNQSLVSLKQLEERAQSTRTAYEAALLRLEQVKGREEIQRPDARILSHAAVPRLRSFPPSRALMLGGAIPASLFLGFLAVILRELLANGFRTSAQLEQTLALPVLAMAPEVTGRKARSLTNIVSDSPCSSFAESIRGIQLGLYLPDADRPPRVILVTSAMPREGKSTLALSLARSAARDGKKVVLMDCDLRRPKLLSLVRGGRIKKGLVHALLGRESVENCLHKDASSEVMLLAPETAVENPALLLGSLEMEKLIQGLRGSADLIIVDSAPLLPVNDTKLLVRLIDTMLFVVRWEKTPRNAAIAAVRSLFDLHAPIAGVVVTRADPKQYYAYSYGLRHYSSYGQYYRD